MCKSFNILFQYNWEPSLNTKIPGEIFKRLLRNIRACLNLFSVDVSGRFSLEGSVLREERVNNSLANSCKALVVPTTTATAMHYKAPEPLLSCCCGSHHCHPLPLCPSDCSRQARMSGSWSGLLLSPPPCLSSACQRCPVSSGGGTGI